MELSKLAYHFVRDEINHSMDDPKYLNEKPYLKASEVAKNKVGFCFGKSVLLAAILRALGIPCGFSDQLLMFDEDVSDRKIIHTLNVVYLKSLKKWIRLDARGNKPKDVDAEFDLAEEKIAYPARSEFAEVNNLGIYSDVSASAIALYQKSETNAKLIDNLFDEINDGISAAYIGEGVMINSDFLDGKTNAEAQEAVSDILIQKKIASKKTNFRLRNWGVSRQRYWGCPIPILYLEDGSTVPVPEDQLPVELPKDVEFTGLGNPLDLHPTWKYTTYTDANGKTQKAVRETDTFDTFFESSWYFLRYISKSENKAFERDLVNKIMPVDQYVGGVEHAVLHLLYARFFTKALAKCGYLDVKEPFKNLLTQGMVCHHTFKDKEGKWVFASDALEVEKGKFISEKTREEIFIGRSEKMSKSKKNVVEPSSIIDSYGADTARLFMLSDTPVSRDLDWSEAGIDGAWRYSNRLWKLISSYLESDVAKVSGDLSYCLDQQFFVDKLEKNLLAKDDLSMVRLAHKTIAEVEAEYEKMGFNRAIAKIREFSNALEKYEISSKDSAEIAHFSFSILAILISPIMPHLAEELWQMLGNKGLVVNCDFPKFDQKFLLEDSCKVALQVSGKLRAVIEMPKGLSQEEMQKRAFESENVSKFVEGKEVKKVIVIADKLVNIVIV